MTQGSPNSRKPIGASDAKKRDPEVFRREILDPPTPRGVWVKQRRDNLKTSQPEIAYMLILCGEVQSEAVESNLRGNKHMPFGLTRCL